MCKRPPAAVREGHTADLQWRQDGSATTADAPVVLALHGQGMTVDFFAALLQPLFDLPIHVLTPQAPLHHRNRGTGRSGPSWYAYDGNQTHFRSELERLERMLADFVGELEHALGLRPRHRVLLGFSQGGYGAAYVALRRQDLFGGMVISGARVKVEILHDEICAAGKDGFAALLCHGRRDASVDPAAAQSGSDALRNAGVAVQLRTFDSGHALGGEQITVIRDWLRELWTLA